MRYLGSSQAVLPTYLVKLLSISPWQALSAGSSRIRIFGERGTFASSSVNSTSQFRYELVLHVSGLLLNVPLFAGGWLFTTASSAATLAMVFLARAIAASFWTFCA